MSTYRLRQGFDVYNPAFDEVCLSYKEITPELNSGQLREIVIVDEIEFSDLNPEVKKELLKKLNSCFIFGQ